MADVPARSGRTSGRGERARVGRRAFIGYVLGGATLAVAADLGLGTPAYAAVPSAPQIPELYDLEDLQTDAALPTSALIKIVINEDGTASFELPRMEVGQESPPRQR